MASHEKSVETPGADPFQNEETLALLKGIIDELKKIGTSQVRQDERIEALMRAKVSPGLLDEESLSILVS